MDIGITSGALCYRIAAWAALSNLAINLLLPPMLPWIMLPVLLMGMGIAIGFPTLSLTVLDRFPATRGAGASLQTSSSLLLMAALSGLVSPLVSHHPLWLAAASATLTALGYASWKLAKHRLTVPAVHPVTV